MRKSLVSLVALGLFLGAPALADTAMAESTSKATSTQQQSGLDSEQFEKLLQGYEERSEVEGRLARAMTIEGNQVLVLVGPENLEAGGSVEAEDSDIRDRFQEAGFTGVEILEEGRIARAELDDEHYIFALSIGGVSGSGMQTGSAAGQTGTAGSTTTSETGTQSGTTGTQSGSTTMSQTDSQTDTQSGTQSGSTTLSQTDTQTGTTGAQSGSTTTGETGTAGSTTMSQTDTQTGTTATQSGSTTTGQTGTQTGTTGTGSGSTTMSQTDTQTGTTGTQSGSTVSQTDTQTGTAGTGQVGRALSEPDAERMVSDLEEAGLEEAKEFKGRLLRASTEDGADVFFIIAPKDMESDAEVDISEEEIRSKLEQANLDNIEFIDDAKVVRGSLEGDHVFVLAGDIMGTRQ